MYHINKEITANGESLVLNNTAKHYFKDFKILGNSKQKTRSGKNMINPNKKTVTALGLTYTYNSDNDTINIKGTTTSSNVNLEITSLRPVLKKGVAYTQSIITVSGKQENINIVPSVKNSNGEITYNYFFNNATKTPTEDLTIQTYNAYCAVSGATIDWTFKIQLEESPVATEYEQHGASPSIEYESPIESVGDNINLFNVETITNAILNTDGGTINNDVWRTSDYIEVMPLNNYTFSWLSDSSYFQALVGMYDSNKNFIERREITVNSAYENVFQTVANCKYVRTSYSVGVSGVDVIRDKIKLEKGTKATPYSPYGQGSIEIYNVNKNWLPALNKTTTTLNGVTIMPNGDGTYTANGTSTDVIAYRITTVEGVNSYIHKLPAGKYIVSSENTSYSTHFLQLIMRDDIKGQTWHNTNPNIEFETSGGTYQALIYIRSGVTLNNFVFKPMLRLATIEDETYVKHEEQTQLIYTQQPLREVGDVKDRFVKVDGVWYEQHFINKKVLNGNANVGYSAEQGEYTIFQIPVGKLLGSNVKSTKLPAKHNWGSNFNHESIWTGGTTNSSLQIKILSSRVSDYSATAIKAWLAENNMTVIYALETPTLIECTPEQVEQLESLEKEFYSYDEQTNIYSTDAISPIFDVTAYQRISEEFKTRLKEGKITRGYLKVLATDVLPEIIIDENNYLKDLKLEELRYVPEEGFIGGAVAKRVTGNFNNVDNSFDIQDRQIEVYLGVELEDETTEYIKYGTYIVQRPEDDQVTDNTSFEALDYMVKFNTEYTDRITYPCTFKQLLNDVLDQAGVNSKVNTFANSDFIVENNQFEQGTTLRDVAKAIAQMAFNWARIDEDDNFVMDFEMTENIDEELGTDDYFGFKKTDDYGPVNVIVLRNSQIEGENVTIKDEALINSPKGYNLLPVETINTTINNVTIVNNGDGSITLNGTASAYIPITIFANKEIKFKPDMYTVKMKEISGTYTTSSQFLELQDENSQRVMFFGGISGNTSLSQEKIVTKCYIAFATGTVFDNYTFALSLTDSTNSEKPYQPYIPIGEVELVIADNPFAYTELKRKQLIEAGRRLFGLRYTPMTVDMLGLMYLNAKDRIAVENLNGEKFNTYLLDHTIDYTGIVLDSMESKAKTKTETKYQYVSPLSQGLSHVEIKVDKANKRIDAIVKDQEDVSEKVANTVTRIEVVYALSDSPTEPPTDGWDTTAPPWVEGKYMWQKTITTYANGTSVETAATNISGAQGKDGISGNNSYSYVAFANSADGSKDFSRTDSTNKTYIGTLTINESVNENLLKKTNQGITNWLYSFQNGEKTIEAYDPEGVNGVKMTCISINGGWQYTGFRIDESTLKQIKENTNYILSFDLKTNIGAKQIGILLTRSDGTNNLSTRVQTDIFGNEEWEHISVEIKTIEDFSNITIGNQLVYIAELNKVGYYIIKNLKLEEGYRESSYSKSPEDLADDYTKYYWQYTKGEEGVGVSAVVDEYYLSTSDTEQVGGEWKETQDAFEEGKYIWTRSKITWTNGSTTYTTPILANTLNNINSNIVVLQTFQSTQTATNKAITDSVSSVTTRLNNDYLTEKEVNSKIDGLDKEYEILEERVATTELTAEGFKVQIDTINNQGVDKITTSMGYTFNDNGLNINRDNADTGTIVNETGIQVLDKTGAEEIPLLYAGYVKEGNPNFSDYEGQTIVATSNLIVKNFLVIGSNSRFQDYENLTLGGQGTGAFEI